ncbi:MAG TPA: TonB-dependent receptor, partial [Burkholderiales bacterium]|nr:TonB-dependent receptor [Burkholderiales bacterium]
MRRRHSYATLLLGALAGSFPAAARADGPIALQEVSVTATREAQPLVETPASVGIITGETIQQVKPTHPWQIMNQVPGVAVGVTNGEGHTTAIRQPFTTSPVYLFLEDGIPSRSTGFFNHNGLYEINIPQAGGIEVVRGPGSALYGSDAVAGVINVLTPAPPPALEIRGSLELGDHGWIRGLLSGGSAAGDDGWRGDLNLTHTDGWRDSTAYDRQSGFARWDHAIGGNAMLKTLLGFSYIDQQTGANSPLIYSDYQNNPTLNYMPIAYRKVGAFRLSTTYDRYMGDSLLSVTPYFRDNSMDLLASFRLSFDPTLAETENQSYGVMLKWRRDFAPLRARLIAGLDLDYSPGSRDETRLNVVTRGAGASRRFLAYTFGPQVYDYDVSFSGVSPYLHGEISPVEKLRVTAGLRYDHLSYDFDNNFLPVAVAAAGRFYGQAPDTRVNFDRASPKIGATYALSPDTHLRASFNTGFRAPSEGQLFRPSNATSAAAAQLSALSALGLEAIKAEQWEAGVRGAVAGLSYDLALYNLELRDDIVSYRDPATNATTVVNAGETRHRGVEVGLGTPLGRDFRFDV